MDQKHLRLVLVLGRKINACIEEQSDLFQEEGIDFFITNIGAGTEFKLLKLP